MCRAIEPIIPETSIEGIIAWAPIEPIVAETSIEGIIGEH
jgi:hypothetical protein